MPLLAMITTDVSIMAASLASYSPYGKQRLNKLMFTILLIAAGLLLFGLCFAFVHWFDKI